MVGGAACRSGPATPGTGSARVGLVFAVFGAAPRWSARSWPRPTATRLPRFRTYLVAFLITGLPRFVMFALGVPLWAILVVCVVGGCASGFLNPVLGAVDLRADPARRWWAG